MHYLPFGTESLYESKERLLITKRGVLIDGGGFVIQSLGLLTWRFVASHRPREAMVGMCFQCSPIR